MNIDRQLATVRRISELKPIEGADRIELAIVDGWQVVVKKREFNTGDLAVYFEIDSWVPLAVAPFLKRSSERSYNGIIGERLKTIKMKGQLSQGLLLPIRIAECISGNPLRQFREGEDLTELLGVQKWEKEIPAQLTGLVKGNFPSFLVKTDQPRIQNQYKYVTDILGLYELSEKLDGSSMTVYSTMNDGELVQGVCSRNLDLKRDENNAFWKVAIRENLLEKLSAYGENIALQGELVGPGVQGNPYQLNDLQFFVFDIFSIDSQTYLGSDARIRACIDMNLNHVPILGAASITKTLENTGAFVNMPLQEILNLADGPSMLNRNVAREGIVWKMIEDPHNTFKAISNEWLLKDKE
ncbi:MAG TPA: RNA ligase (ATP) [Mesotoga sp.]|nr:RNA ligase (ATP) [Mesotoga sp.]